MLTQNYLNLEDYLYKMKRILPIVLLLLPIQIFAQLNSESISVGNETRDYVEYIPSNYQNAEAAPLIIILHGIGGFAADYATYGLNPIADTARFIPVYLQGELNSPGPFGQTAWNNGTLLASTADDLAFIENIIDTMAVNYNIDRSRVYIVGISMGAIMTYKALHHLSDKLAAAVCHIGTMSNEELTNYSPSIPRPVMQIHGVNDVVVPYSGQALPSLGLVPPTLAKLKSVNGWNGDSTITNIPNTANDSVTIEKIVYNTATRLEHWKMSGAGAGHIVLFEPINDTSGMEITWHFLREFTHPNPTLNLTKSFVDNQPLLFPNPTCDFLNIENYENFKQIRLYNLNQQLVFETSSTVKIDLSHLDVGLYIIQLIDKEGDSYSQLLNKQ
jgi:polyhydroxybutyrate depolymerase